MKTKPVLIIGLLIFAMLLASCASADPEEDLPYAFFISHQTNAFTNELTASVKAKADELGVVVNVYDGEKDVAKQVSQIETAVTQGVAGIVIEPVSVDGVVPALAAAKEAGIPVEIGRAHV